VPLPSSFPHDIDGVTTTLDSRVAGLASRQHGVVSYSQLEKLGLKRGAIEHRLRDGRLHRLHKGVYAVGHPRVTWHGRLMAAVLACRRGAAISHRTAGDLSGVRKTSSPRIEVTTTRRIRRPGIVVHQTRSLPPTDVTEIHGIPVTAPGRTLIDLSKVLRPNELQRAVEQAERLGLLDRRAIEGRPGASRVMRALAQFEPEALKSRSDWEAEFVDFCRDHDIPRPTLNAVVHGYEVDALWKEEKLIVELDSWEFHRGRRSFEEDRRRSAALQRHGFSVLRLTHRMLNEEAEESAATILDLLTSVGEVTR
jgi:Transcriptional regulator, AbiEi antitoxin/Protein of unknown function (DUF559)